MGAQDHVGSAYSLSNTQEDLMSKQKLFYDPYSIVLDEFNRKNIKYVVIGMSGINYYASNVREAFGTLDFDVFIKPTINNIKKTLFALNKLDYIITIGGHEITNKTIADIIRQKKTISASDPYGILIELILAVSGFTFSQMEKDAKIFMIGNIPIKVAQLTKLLASKKIANRSKDRLFLKRYEILLNTIQKKNKEI